jgi:hypothetical protein
MQQFMKPPSGAARAGVVAPQLLDQLFVLVDDALALFHTRLRWVAPAALAGRLKSSPIVRIRSAISCCTSIVKQFFATGKNTIEAILNQHQPSLLSPQT